jgi:hypothetical protein
MDIERDLRAVIEAFDGSPATRTCRQCGHVQTERAPLPAPVTSHGGGGAAHSERRLH